MVLTPIVLSIKEISQSQVIQPQQNSGKPSRPINVVSPPAVTSLNRAISIKVEGSSFSIPSIDNASLSALELSYLSESHARVRIKQQPEYPLYAQRRGIEGRVVVEFDIDSSGIVINPRIADSESTSVFNQSVLKAINGYRYEPYRLGGEAIGLQGLKEEFRFQLIQDQPTKAVSIGDSQTGQNIQLDSS
jgi:protein TonB